MRKGSSLRTKKAIRKMLKCCKCKKHYKDNSTHKCSSLVICQYCLVKWRSGHKKKCPYFLKMKKIEKLIKENRKQYKYIHLHQIGFLNESAVNPFDLSQCEDNERSLGNKLTLVYVKEVKGSLQYLPPPTGSWATTKTLIPDETYTYPLEVPGNAYAVVIGCEKVQEKTLKYIREKAQVVDRICAVVFTVCDPISITQGFRVKCLFVSKDKDSLPKYQYLSIIRLHRILLLNQTDTSIVLQVTPSVSAWLVLNRCDKGGVISQSGKKYTWNYHDDLLFDAYAKFANLLAIKGHVETYIDNTTSSEFVKMELDVLNPYDICYQNYAIFQSMLSSEKILKKHHQEKVSFIYHSKDKRMPH